MELMQSLLSAASKAHSQTVHRPFPCHALNNVIP
jgi:hypothetical protein